MTHGSHEKSGFSFSLLRNVPLPRSPLFISLSFLPFLSHLFISFQFTGVIVLESECLSTASNCCLSALGFGTGSDMASLLRLSDGGDLFSSNSFP